MFCRHESAYFLACVSGKSCYKNQRKWKLYLYIYCSALYKRVYLSTLTLIRMTKDDLKADLKNETKKVKVVLSISCWDFDILLVSSKFLDQLERRHCKDTPYFRPFYIGATNRPFLGGLKKGLHNAIWSTTRINDAGESIFENEFLCDFKAKIKKFRICEWDLFRGQFIFLKIYFGSMSFKTAKIDYVLAGRYN
jgi:hypothetical protein